MHIRFSLKVPICFVHGKKNPSRRIPSRRATPLYKYQKINKLVWPRYKLNMNNYSLEVHLSNTTEYVYPLFLTLKELEL